MSEIILASGSEIRAQMLRDAGLEFRVLPARIDEAAIKASLLAENAPPRDVADVLAALKAQRVAGKNPDGLVIGADQVLELDGTIFSKPADLQESKAQLRALAGKTHTLHSAAVIHHGQRPIWRHISRVDLTMRDISEAFLDRYIEQAGPEILHSVGAFQIEAAGIRLFSKINGPYHAILGLPLIEMLNFLHSAGHIQS